MLPFNPIVVDEVGQVPVWIFERLMRLWKAVDSVPALVFVGDMWPLPPMAENGIQQHQATKSIW